MSKNEEWRRLGRVASSSAVLTIANVMSAVMTLLTIPFIIHGTGMAGYGMLVMVQAFALVVTRFFDAQSWQTYIRAVGLGFDKAAAVRVGLTLDMIALFGVLLAVLSAGTFIQLWQAQTVAFDIAALFALSIVNQCVFSWVGVLRLEGKFTVLALTTFVPSVFRLAGIAALSFMPGGLSLRAVAWIYALAEIFRFSLTLWCAWRLLAGSLRAAWQTHSRETWAAVRSFTFWNWLMNLVDLPIQYLDSLLVGRLLSVEAVGVYGAIKRIAGVCSQVSAPLYQVIFPEFTRLVADRALGACHRLLWRSAWIMSALGLPAMVILFVLRQWWMPVFGLPLTYTVELFFFMLLQIAAVAFIAIHPLMNALGMVRAGFYIILFSNLVFLGALYVLGQRYALMGIIMAAGIQFALVICAKTWLVERHLRQEGRPA